MTSTQRAAFIILIVVCTALAVSVVVFAFMFGWWLAASALTTFLSVILVL